jgi:hypothetical protein
MSHISGFGILKSFTQTHKSVVKIKPNSWNNKNTFSPSYLRFIPCNIKNEHGGLFVFHITEDEEGKGGQTPFPQFC